MIVSVQKKNITYSEKPNEIIKSLLKAQTTTVAENYY